MAENKQANANSEKKKRLSLSLRHRPKEGNEGGRKRFLEARDDDLGKSQEEADMQEYRKESSLGN